MTKLTLSEAERLASLALLAAGAHAQMAQATACALVRAESQGIGTHGLSRVTQYCTHLRNGRALGKVLPTVLRDSLAVAVIDAGEGLAFPACALAVEQAIERARRYGVSLVLVTNSHHFGVAGDHLWPVATAGMVGLAMGNSPAAMPAAGGKHPIFGTNPIAAIFPRPHQNPLLIDLSLSEVARGKVLAAARDGKPIPLGWALDAQGQPTTDAAKALEGSMLPVGAATSAKGSMLALVVELLVTSLTGAAFGAEASQFFVDEGNRPRMGQAFLVINPAACAGPQVYAERIEALVGEMLKDEGVRLPGQRRFERAEQAQRDGIEVSDALLASWGLPVAARPLMTPIPGARP